MPSRTVENPWLRVERPSSRRDDGLSTLISQLRPLSCLQPALGIYLPAPPPSQLRRPRKPVGRAQRGDSRNKRREPQGEASSAVWVGGWEVCFHSVCKGGFVRFFNG